MQIFVSKGLRKRLLLRGQAPTHLKSPVGLCLWGTPSGPCRTRPPSHKIVSQVEGGRTGDPGPQQPD